MNGVDRGRRFDYDGISERLRALRGIKSPDPTKKRREAAQ